MLILIQRTVLLLALLLANFCSAELLAQQIRLVRFGARPVRVLVTFAHHMHLISEDLRCLAFVCRI